MQHRVFSSIWCNCTHQDSRFDVYTSRDYHFFFFFFSTPGYAIKFLSVFALHRGKKQHGLKMILRTWNGEKCEKKFRWSGDPSHPIRDLGEDGWIWSRALGIWWRTPLSNFLPPWNFLWWLTVSQESRFCDFADVKMDFSKKKLNRVKVLVDTRILRYGTCRYDKNSFSHFWWWWWWWCKVSKWVFVRPTRAIPQNSRIDEYSHRVLIENYETHFNIGKMGWEGSPDHRKWDFGVQRCAIPQNSRIDE